MQKQVQQQATITIEFEVPCYVKFTDKVLYKIIDEKKIITVKTFGFTTSIQVEDFDQVNPFRNNGWEFTTEEEYLKAENKALLTIGEYANFPEVV